MVRGAENKKKIKIGRANYIACVGRSLLFVSRLRAMMQSSALVATNPAQDLARD